MRVTSLRPTFDSRPQGSLIAADGKSTTRSFADTNAPNRFYRVGAQKPLLPTCGFPRRLTETPVDDYPAGPAPKRGC